MIAGFFQTAWSFVVQNWVWFAVGAGVLIALIIVLCAVGAASRRKRNAINYAPKTQAAPTASEQAEPAEEPKPAPKKPTAEPAVKAAAQEKKAAQQESAATKPEQGVSETRSQTPVTEEPPVEAESEGRVAYSGKWEIRHVGDKEYVAYLRASNGEVIFRSEAYTSVDGARAGVETIRKNVGLGKFDVHRDKRGNFYFKVKSSLGRLLGSSATYATESSVTRAMESVKRFSGKAVVSDEVVEDMTVTAYQPTTPWNPAAKGYRGKWVIVEENGMYYAQLFASNGELMLCSESSASEETAFAKLNNIRKNVYEQRFFINVDKKGKYTFTLRNSQRTALCISESYDSYAACANAIESVVRFCATATAPDED